MKEEMWLARNDDERLWLIIGSKPIKYKFMWGNFTWENSIELDEDLFPEVKWSDNEPTKVQLVIVK